jgi:hypothetical protein
VGEGRETHLHLMLLLLPLLGFLRVRERLVDHVPRCLCVESSVEDLAFEPARPRCLSDVDPLALLEPNIGHVESTDHPGSGFKGVVVG